MTTGLEERLSAALAEMSEGLRPQPDPYGRARARLRRSRRRRAGIAAVAVVALVAGGAAAVANRPAPAPSASTLDGWRAYLAWGQRLVDSPPRGAVAADAAFLAELTRIVGIEQPKGTYPNVDGQRTPRVLFVDDLADRRVALVAFVKRGTVAPNDWPWESAWLEAPRGAMPAELATSSPGGGDGIDVFEVHTLSTASGNTPAAVAVAPDGCATDAAPWPAVQEWEPVPTVSYVLRPGGAPPQWWRVTCDGEVQQIGPVPGGPTYSGVTDGQYATAIQRARGGALDREQTALALQAGWGYGVAAVPSVVWSGRLGPARPDKGGRAVMVSAPAVLAGEWLGSVSVTFDEPRADSLGYGIPFHATSDPTDEDSVVVARLDHEGSELLVVTPVAATRVRAVAGGQEVASAPVAQEAALLSVPDPEAVTVEALDALGQVVGTGRLVPLDRPTGELYAWR